MPAVLGFFLRRTGDPDLTADLTAEVLAAALLCLVSVGGNNSGTGCGLTAAEIRERGSGLSDDSGTVSELVPDGVATVTLRFPPVQGRPAYSVTGRVVGNLMAVRRPHMLGGSSDQPIAVWRAADGRIVKDDHAAHAGSGPGLLPPGKFVTHTKQRLTW